MGREAGGGSGTHVNPWLIHVNVWEKPLQYCKVISLQLIKINEKKKKKLLVLYSPEWCLEGFKEKDIPGKHYLLALLFLFGPSPRDSPPRHPGRTASRQIWDPLKEM